MKKSKADRIVESLINDRISDISSVMGLHSRRTSLIEDARRIYSLVTDISGKFNELSKDLSKVSDESNSLGHMSSDPRVKKICSSLSDDVRSAEADLKRIESSKLKSILSYADKLDDIGA